MNPEEYEKLIPKLPAFLKTSIDSKFTLFLHPEIKDLSFYGPETILNLFKQFVESQDYELRSLLLSIIFSTFSMRKLTFKQIETIQVITTAENSELFM